MKVIQGKIKGRTPKLKERESPQSADVVDLMARLHASLEGKGTAGGTKKAASLGTASRAKSGKKKSATRKRSSHAA